MGVSRQSTAADLIEELKDQGAEHKKIERRARALAQRSYATAREIEEFCKAHGIPVERKERQ